MTALLAMKKEHDVMSTRDAIRADSLPFCFRAMVYTSKMVRSEKNQVWKSCGKFIFSENF